MWNPLSLMSKGEEKQAKEEGSSEKQAKEVLEEALEYCHQCQRGRLLEILSLMEKEHKGAAPRQGSWSDSDGIVAEKESKVVEATRVGFRQEEVFLNS